MTRHSPFPHNLTPAERRAVEALMRCERAKQAAHELGVGVATVRSQLASARDKAGVKSLHQLLLTYAEAINAPTPKNSPAARLQEFGAFIAEHSVEVGNCTEWIGKMRRGRSGASVTPVIETQRDGEPISINVPRLIWEAKRGPVPAGMLVFRSCCNNHCIKHLTCGTVDDLKTALKAAGKTRQSMATRAAITAGARANAKYSIEAARNVRKLAAEGINDCEISRRTGVERRTVSNMRRGLSWGESPGAPSVLLVMHLQHA